MRVEVERWQAGGVALAVLWLFVRGVRPSVVNVAQELLIGLVLGMATAYVFRRLFPGTTNLAYDVRAVPYAVVYLLIFLYDLLTANVDVAKRVLLPSQPIYPEVVVVPLRVEKPAAITTIANSITLTPGTLTMDYDDEHNALYVHAIDGRDPGAVVEPIRRWEDYALVIFGEERQPGDPAPDVPLEPPVGGERGDD